MQRSMSVACSQEEEEMPDAVQRTDTREAYGYWTEDFRFLGMDFPNQHQFLAYIREHFGGLKNLPPHLVESFGNIEMIVSGEVNLPLFRNPMSLASPRLPTVNPTDPVSVAHENQSLIGFLCNEHKTRSLVWNYQGMVDRKGWEILNLMIFLTTL